MVFNEIIMNTNDFINNAGKIIIPVPAGYRYIGEWSDFDINFFNGPYIIDKQIPGCGFTEYVLTNKYNTILCSPRKILLENKESQHPGDIYYAKNEYDPELSVDKDLMKKVTLKSTSTEEIHDCLNAKEKMQDGLLKYCRDCSNNSKPIKIIVTYDSFKYVKEILFEKGILSAFSIVIDEFQSVFVDSRFKADTEFGFIRELQGLSNNICFVSATPMLDKYLRQIDYFKDLPYFELDWGILDPSRICKPELKIRKTRSICSEMKRIIEEYKSRDFSVLANPLTGELVQSKEAVFYVNSVNDIIKIIISMGLLPEEINILCAKTPQNKSKIQKKLGKKYQIGSVPLRGEPHKMFTFCTRTVYLGADFYSTCARTFILSDANIDSLSVDISLDLPQILGRQRLLENPWKNHAEFYFKTLGRNNIIYKTREDFENRLKEKLSATEASLNTYLKIKDNEREKIQLCRKYKNDILFSTYSEDYVSVNFIDGEYQPVMNNLVYVAEQRAFDIQQIDYKDRFTVFNALKGENFQMDRISEMIDKLRDTSIYFSDRLRYLCETPDFTDDEKKLIASQASESFDQYYNLVGPERCKALWYNITSLKQEVSDMSISKQDIIDKLDSVFEIGKKYSNQEAKELIKQVYSDLGYSKSPKATDLGEFYNLKKLKFVNTSGKSVNGFKLINKI